MLKKIEKSNKLEEYLGYSELKMFRRLKIVREINTEIINRVIKENKENLISLPHL